MYSRKILDPQQMTRALAIAGSHASGTMEFDQSGGEVKRLHNGMACCGGLRSALLAQIGLTGPPTIFEGERGILKVMAGASRIDPIVENLETSNDDLAVYHAAMKRFPVNASQHSPIELLDSLAKTHQINAKEVTKIGVAVNEGILLHSGTIYQPREVIQAQFSLCFSLALRLLEGNNDLEHYLDPNMWNDPRILEIAKKIELSVDPAAVAERRFACRMKIQLSDGQEINGSLAAPKGSYKNPLSSSELHEKFYRLGRSAVADDKLASMIDLVAAVESTEDVGVISALAAATE